MSPFIGMQDGKIQVHIPKCELANTHIEIEFKIAETTNTGGEDEADEEKDQFSQSTESQDRRASSIQKKQDEVDQLKVEFFSLKKELQVTALKVSSLEGQLQLKTEQVQQLTQDKEKLLTDMQALSLTEGGDP